MTDPAFWLALGAAILSGFSIVLHVVAPRTKATWDDKLRDDVDEVLAFVRGQQPSKPQMAAFAAAVAKAADPPEPAVVTIVKGATPGLLGLVLAAGLIAAYQLACTSAQRTSAGHAVVDCTAANATTIAQLAASMRGDCAAGAGTDWACVRSHAIGAGLQVGGCAFLELVSAELPAARVASATGEPPPERPGRAAFESYRASVAGGIRK